MAGLAKRQRGNVTRSQLLRVGLTRSAIGVRIRRGTLDRRHRGVYGFGAEVPFSREMAAVLAAGRRTVVSQGSAGYLWALVPEPNDAVHLTGPSRAQRPGLRFHRLPLEPGEVARCRGIPVTTVLRTILDLSADLRLDELERVVAEAERRRLITLRQLERGLQQRSRCHGAPVLRAVLASASGPAFTRSEAERRLLALVRAAGLPAPEHNVAMAGNERDLVWFEQRLVVETDGWEYHGDRTAFEADRARDAALLAQGVRTMRVTWRELSEHPHRVVARIAQALLR